MDIADDGAGLPCPVTPGVGMESMAQRAEEAGGTLSFAVPPGGGTAVALADDHELFRKGLRALPATLPGLAFAGEASSGAEALRLTVTVSPDVLLLDIRMPGMDGMAALAKIRVAAPDVAVVMLTMIDDDATLANALRAGAVGYLLRGVPA